MLVGGLGSRLRPVVADVPKPIAPVAGRPFLAWVLDRLREGGMRRVVLAAGYRADLLEAAIGRDWEGMLIDYSIEHEPLGTGGAIALACRSITYDGVHVLNGDTHLDYDFDAFERATIGSGCPIGLALAHVDDTARYGAVVVQDGRATGFTEKGRTGAGWINGGAYFLTREAMDGLPRETSFSFEQAVLAPATSAGRVAAFRKTTGFIDIGIPEDYALAQARFAS